MFQFEGVNGEQGDEPEADGAEQFVPPPPAPGRGAEKKKELPTAPGWKKTLEQLRRLELDHRVPQSEPPAVFPEDRRILYFIDVHRTLDGGHGLAVEVMLQKRQRGGTWDRPKSWSIDQRLWLNAPEETDRMIAQLLMGAQQNGWYPVSGAQWFNVPGNRYDTILRRMCDSGRCGLRSRQNRRISSR